MYDAAARLRACEAARPLHVSLLRLVATAAPRLPAATATRLFSSLAPNASLVLRTLRLLRVLRLLRLTHASNEMQVRVRVRVRVRLGFRDGLRASVTDRVRVRVRVTGQGYRPSSSTALLNLTSASSSST